jgi:hypothetical protein
MFARCRSGAYTDVIFGLFWLLGYRFSPRIADIGGARYWRVDTARRLWLPEWCGQAQCSARVDAEKHGEAKWLCYEWPGRPDSELPMIRRLSPLSRSRRVASSPSCRKSSTNRKSGQPPDGCRCKCRASKIARSRQRKRIMERQVLGRPKCDWLCFLGLQTFQCASNCCRRMCEVTLLNYCYRYTPSLLKWSENSNPGHRSGTATEPLR